jgi:hypothetical protein
VNPCENRSTKKVHFSFRFVVKVRDHSAQHTPTASSATEARMQSKGVLVATPPPLTGLCVTKKQSPAPASLPPRALHRPSHSFHPPPPLARSATAHRRRRCLRRAQRSPSFFHRERGEGGGGGGWPPARPKPLTTSSRWFSSATLASASPTCSGASHATSSASTPSPPSASSSPPAASTSMTIRSSRPRSGTPPAWKVLINPRSASSALSASLVSLVVHFQLLVCLLHLGSVDLFRFGRSSSTVVARVPCLLTERKNGNNCNRLIHGLQIPSFQLSICRIIYSVRGVPTDCHCFWLASAGTELSLVPITVER